MTEIIKSKAYIDGFLYTENEQRCTTCGELTNRVNVTNYERQCENCSGLIVALVKDGVLI